jgi:hypothetical protein
MPETSKVNPSFLTFPTSTSFVKNVADIEDDHTCVPSYRREEEKAEDDNGVTMTIIGYGSLLSERSARSTFPNLKNFRLGRVPNHRRVFGHVASVFFRQNIANKETLEMSSVDVEPCRGSSFVCSVFEVDNEFLLMDDGYGGEMKHDGGVLTPCESFRKREETFDFSLVPYLEEGSSSSDITSHKKGVLCTKSTDDDYILRWGDSHFHNQFGQYGITTIWDWDTSSQLKPCPTYLRHCVLAAQKLGDECYDSFLDETYLVDRETTIREYLDNSPHVMEACPPPELASRYGG